jgi:beta-N-acetylhexosaminidase
MSLDEKVGQLLMAHFHGEAANEEARVLVEEVGVGGIIYYNWANGLTSMEQVKGLSQGLQKMAKVPLLIAADQEGGRVERLRFKKFPANREVGESGRQETAEEVGFEIGTQLMAAGINMNLAPVVDVDTNPKNPVIGNRSFSRDPERVAAFGKSALRGYEKAGVIATLKHFPGHGDVTVDSHAGLPKVEKGMQELEAVELLPFARLAKEAKAIITAHILVPAMDEKNCATLSKKILGYLREELGFEGVIVSDSLVMDGVLDQCGSVEIAAVRALEAGCDLLILGGKLLNGSHAGFEMTVQDVKKVKQAIVKAVEEGRLSEERVDEAVKRILFLKRSGGAPL